MVRVRFWIYFDDRPKVCWGTTYGMGEKEKSVVTQGLSWSCSLICRKPGLVNFLGGPMAKILCSQCRRPRFDPWSWN